MGEQQSTDLVITALDMAAATRGSFPAGVVLHADRGTQFTSQKLAAYMRAVKGRVSMGQAGVCWDNAMAESFWATLTTEYYYRRALHRRPGLHRGRHLDRRLLQPPPHPHQPRRQIPHRKRTTPRGPDHSHINKPSTTCTQAHVAVLRG